MNWVDERQACPECGAAINHRHEMACAMRLTGSQVIWFGTALSPGMEFRVVVEGDVMAGMLLCMYCEHGFDAQDVIAENRSQTVALHAKCVLELAAMIPRSQPSAAEVRAEFERRRAKLAQGE